MVYRGLKVKSNEGESTVENDLSHYFVGVGQESFETITQINGTLKRTEFDSAFCEKWYI